MNPQTISWLTAEARRLVDQQLAEAARLDTKARELVGFTGVVLALLATAVSAAGNLRDLEWLFLAGGLLSSAILIAAGLRAVDVVAFPPDYETAGEDYLAWALTGHGLRQPALLMQANALRTLVRAAARNRTKLDGAQGKLADAYVLFAAALGSATVVVVALVASVI